MVTTEIVTRSGVRRIVHVSIAHPSIESQLPDFEGKAQVERALAETGISFAVLRPALLFGGDGVLLNNIALLLRRLPIFAIGGRGDYRIRGIHVDDLAQLCLEKGAELHDSACDAVGPERPTFVELVTMLKKATGSRSHLVRVPGATLPLFSWALGLFLGDVLLTADEYKAMLVGLADTDGPAAGSTELSDWLAEHGD
jgi:uncharacterized protein YbjT (DUF2867 family)